MREVVIVEAVRSPLGKRKGSLSAMHSCDLLAHVQRALFQRTGMDPAEVGQVVGGCVGQVGMQAMNVTRNAWLTAGLPLEVPASTVDAQCGSSQQATNLAYALVKSGVGRRGGGLRRRGDEPRADGRDHPQGAASRQAGDEQLLEAPRVHLPVRGRRPHRRSSGASPARTPTPSASSPRIAPPRPGPTGVGSEPEHAEHVPQDAGDPHDAAALPEPVGDRRADVGGVDGERGLRHPVGHGAANESGADGHHPCAAAGECVSETRCERILACLRRAVDEVRRPGPHARHARHHEAHGTAFDIVGQNTANAEPARRAFFTVAEMAENRIRWRKQGRPRR